VFEALLTNNLIFSEVVDLHCQTIDCNRVKYNIIRVGYCYGTGEN
jgi:hypothetical protein